METFIFCVFVTISIITICVTIAVICYFINEAKYKKEEIIQRKSKIDLEAEIIKNLRELVRADDERKKEKDEFGRKYIYEGDGKTYSLRSEQTQIIVTRVP